MTLISCSSNEEPSVQNNSDIKKAVSQFNDQDLNISKKESLLIEESDAEETIQDDSQPIILAQANIIQNNN
jgi:hypothetical protein